MADARHFADLSVSFHGSGLSTGQSRKKWWCTHLLYCTDPSTLDLQWCGYCRYCKVGRVGIR
jgi:hypothetical protein